MVRRHCLKYLSGAEIRSCDENDLHDGEAIRNFRSAGPSGLNNCGGAYAVVTAKTSTLLALATSASVTEKRVVKAITAASRASGPLIKYKARIEMVNSDERKVQTAFVIVIRVFFSECYKLFQSSLFPHWCLCCAYLDTTKEGSATSITFAR